MASLALQLASAAASLVAALLILGGVVGWGYAAVGWFRGRALLTPEPRLRPTWHFSEVLLCFGLYIVLVMVLQGALVRPALAAAASAGSAVPVASEPQSASPPETSIAIPPDDPRPPGANNRPLDKRTLGLAITADGLAKALAVVGVLLWMTMLDRRSPQRLGLRLKRSDLKVGVIAAAMLLPPVLALQALLTLWTEYQHPVLDIIHQGPGLWLGIAMAVNTVAIAPVAEEFFFRGLLQGWLQRWGGRTDALRAPAADDPTTMGGAADLTDTREPSDLPLLSGRAGLPLSAGGAGAGPADADPVRLADMGAPSRSRPLAQDVALAEPSAALISSDQVAAWPWWPMVASSILFAVVHLGQGAAPIPLFVLALGLGYLYRQTGRLAAPILVHMILNGLSTAITFLTAAA